MSLKSTVCSAFDALGAFEIGSALMRRRHGPGYIRAVNYHATPAGLARALEGQLRFYEKWFENATPADLTDCLEGRRSGARRPGIILSFDDGYVSNFEIAAPLLEMHGFTGWFFVSSDRIGPPNAPMFCEGQDRSEPFMTLEQLRDLHGRGHVIGCHSHSHVRLAAELGEERLRDEIVASRQRLQRSLGFPVDTFCWVGGEEWSYSEAGARLVAEAGYRFAFTTNLAPLRCGTPPLNLDRTNIEADWPMSQVRFYLSGAMDIVYTAKRRRVGCVLAKGIAEARKPAVGETRP